ncbi:MAG: phosphoribosylanthranilate isomerase [Chloroflexota bacterium]
MSNPTVLVKICGVRNLAGAQAAVDAGADLLGFICYPPTRRYVTPAQIAAILSGLRRRSSVRAVGVFVNQPVEVMNALAADCGLDLIQLSGEEGAEVMPLLNRPVIQVMRPLGPLPNPSPNAGGGATSVMTSSLAPTFAGGHWHTMFATSSPPPALGEGLGRGPAVRSRLFATLLEPPAAGWGGAGQLLDFRVARAITALPDRPPVFLAGGLQPENVAGAIAAVRPDGVDVSSGVERHGVQDRARIAAFVAAAKGAIT